MTHRFSYKSDRTNLATATGVLTDNNDDDVDDVEVSMLDDMDFFSMMEDGDDASVGTVVATRMAFKKSSLINTDGRLLLDL
mmetsp:Transcript_26573/g.25438  ORF Transcript_26573/g.25438 Transcript_26573/m.25438 type:complete len:81 (-) Transcript_26573:364-606(-)